MHRKHICKIYKKKNPKIWKKSHKKKYEKPKVKRSVVHANFAQIIHIARPKYTQKIAISYEKFVAIEMNS